MTITSAVTVSVILESGIGGGAFKKLGRFSAASVPVPGVPDGSSPHPDRIPAVAIPTVPMAAPLMNVRLVKPFSYFSSLLIKSTPFLHITVH
jgi:hypothetical protein